MEVKVCKNCRRLFKYLYGPELCPDCITLIPKKGEEIDKKLTAKVNTMINQEEQQYEKIKDYISINPKATIMEISEVNGISALKILEWIRQDRLEFSDDSKDAWFECVKCKTKIKSGIMCHKCKLIK